MPGPQCPHCPGVKEHSQLLPIHNPKHAAYDPRVSISRRKHTLQPSLCCQWPLSCMNTTVECMMGFKHRHWTRPAPLLHSNKSNTHVNTLSCTHIINVNWLSSMTPRTATHPRRLQMQTQQSSMQLGCSVGPLTANSRKHSLLKAGTAGHYNKASPPPHICGTVWVRRPAQQQQAKRRRLSAAAGAAVQCHCLQKLTNHQPRRCAGQYMPSHTHQLNRAMHNVNN